MDNLSKITLLASLCFYIPVTTALKFSETDYKFKGNEYPEIAGSNVSIHHRYRFINDLGIDLPQLDNLELNIDVPISSKSKYQRVQSIVNLREGLSPIIDKNILNLVDYSESDRVFYSFRSKNHDYHLKADNVEDDLYNILLIKHEETKKSFMRTFFDRLGEKIIQETSRFLYIANRYSFGSNVQCLVDFLRVPNNELVLTHTSREDEDPIVILKQWTDGTVWYMIMKEQAARSLWVLAKLDNIQI